MQSVATLQGNSIPASRPPELRDYLIFFFAIPFCIAFIFSLVGVRLTAGMPYPDTLIYMMLHMAVAWWSVSIGAFAVKFLFRSWRPPIIAICTLGYFVAMVPAVFTFQALGDYYATLYPTFAANRTDAMPAWTIDYLLHFIRYSIPALPLYLGGVYSYRSAAGVDWFSYAAQKPAAKSPPVPEPQTWLTETTGKPALAKLIEGTKLPDDAIMLAIKAEQHYINIWSNKGNDLVRYRFKDLADVLDECNGAQVHRSWWVNLDGVAAVNNNGRKTELVISDRLSVPVSVSYKNAVMERLQDRTQ